MEYLSKEDLTNFARIYFSKKFVKLYKNEPHQMMLNNKKIVSIKDLGFGKGSPDLIGWNICGTVFGCEIKTVNDYLSKKQKEYFAMMIKDNCNVFILQQAKNGNIILLNYKTKKLKTLTIEDLK